MNIITLIFTATFIVGLKGKPQQISSDDIPKSSETLPEAITGMPPPEDPEMTQIAGKTFSSGVSTANQNLTALCEGQFQRGTQKNMTCVFPFHYRGENYCKCLPIYWTTYKGSSWCPYSLGVLGSILAWDYCSDTLTVSGAKCVFPFTVTNDTEYNECAPGMEQTKPWCATSLKNESRTVNTSELCAPVDLSNHTMMGMSSMGKSNDTMKEIEGSESQLLAGSGEDGSGEDGSGEDGSGEDGSGETGFGYAGVYNEVDFQQIGGEAKSTSIYSSSYYPSNAFDGDKSTTWIAAKGLPQSLWYEFPQPIIVNKFSFHSRRDYQHISPPLSIRDGPTKYIFWGSNEDNCEDSSKWVSLFEDHSGTRFMSADDAKEEAFENRHSYKCYGFKVIEATGGSSDVAISTVRFFTPQ